MLRRSSRVAATLTGLALAATTATLVPGGPAAVAAEPGSPITLMAPAKVVAYSYDGRAYTNFGLRVAATDAPFEIWSQRADDYEDQITSTWRKPLPAGGYEEVPLPEGAMSSFMGIDDFVSLSVTPVGETSGRTISVTGCLGGNSQRVRPDAPARSPYPSGCPWNPYTLGSVMGIQEGHASTLMEEWSRPMRLKPGRYDVTAQINPTYATFFGVAEADATRSFRLVVKREEEYYRPARTQPDSEVLEPAADSDACAPGSAPEGPRPDLRSLPAWGVELNRKGTALRFAANVWNAGNSPLVVDGFREDDDDHLHAYQYYFDTEGNEVGCESVGVMHWHAENHNHWHFEDFARYRLLNEDRTEKVKSTKQSFCLANTDAVDYTVPGADWHPETTDLSTACGDQSAISVRQVLSAGSGDTYYQYRYGQAFRLNNVEDGIYWIAVEANAAGNLTESNTENNVSYRQVKLWTVRQGPSKGERRVKTFPVGLVDENAPWMSFRTAG